MPKSSLNNKTTIINPRVDGNCAIIVGYTPEKIKKCSSRILIDDSFNTPPLFTRIGSIRINQKVKIEERIKNIVKELAYYRGDCQSVIIFVTDCRFFKSLQLREQLLIQHSPVPIAGIKACPLLKCAQSRKTSASQNTSIIAKIKKRFGFS